MRQSVQTFIVSLVAGSVAVGFLLMGLIDSSVLGRRLPAEKQAELSRVLSLMSCSAEGKYSPDIIINEFSAWRESMARIGDYYRLTLIDHNGRILKDSRIGLTELADNRANRPEVIQALREGHGSSRRYSATAGRDYLYVATRVTFRRTPDLPPLVLRLGLPMAEVMAARNQILKQYVSGAILISLLAALIAFLATRTLNREIKDLIAAARDLADGRLERRLVRLPKNELVFLGLSLNRLASLFSRQARRDRTDQQRLLAVLNNMAEGVLITDTAGNITNSNPALADLFNLKQSPTGFPGEFIRQPEFIEALSRAGQGEIIPPIKLTLPVYPHRIVEARLRPLGDEYQPEGVVTVFRLV